MLSCARRCPRTSRPQALVSHGAPTSRQSSTQRVTPSKVIFSGIQPTGIPHLGNYLGALHQWVKLQNEATASTRLIYSLVDLHAITVRQDPAQLRQWKKQSLAILLAIGLNPSQSIIFHQGDVTAHTELMWILSCQASTGYLARMTQWKDKSASEKENSDKAKLGLFSYPVLQAADVLVHQTTHVPVGHDQAQHLEFARELANGFNHAFNAKVLTPPQTLISPAQRIMSLTEPQSKMSKSHPNPKSRILLTDPEATLRSKLKSAMTDSLPGIEYRPHERPGVSNLLDIIYHCLQASTAQRCPADQNELAVEMRNVSLRGMKDYAADAVEELLKPIRERYAELISNDKLLEDVAVGGAEKASKNAAHTMRKVKRAVGLL